MRSQDPRGRVEDFVQWRRSVCIVFVSKSLLCQHLLANAAVVMRSLQ
jgi:hypothetical protein